MAFNTSNSNSVLAKLFVSGEFSDLTVKSKSGTKEFKVHRNIVCSQSKPLKAALSGNFQEAVTGIYDMDDDEPEIVHALLYFFYHSTYTPTSSPIHAMVFNAKVYVIADKYDVKGLKELSSQKYKQSVQEFPEDSEAFVSSLEILYKGTPRMAPIRAEAFQTAVNRIAVLVKCKAFEELCEENGNIPLDIVKAIVHADMHTFSGVTATALLNCGDIMALCEKNGKLAFGILKSFYRRNSFF